MGMGSPVAPVVPGEMVGRSVDCRALAALPPIPVPAVTLDGMADGNFPATDGTAAAHHFTAARHHQVPAAGHNLPQEAPAAFAGAVLELDTL
jgi:pimeloyl-ACP methyl ester carboxylesterase